MSKLVITSDFHIHPFKAFADGIGRDNSRMQQSLKVLRSVLEKAQELGCPWVDGGDLSHTTGYTRFEVASSVIGVLKDFPEVPKIMVWGNHDSRGRGGRVYLEDTFQYIVKNAVENVHILDHSGVEINGVTFYGCGAQPDESLYTYEEADVGIYHSFVKGAKLPSGIVLSEGIPQDTLLEHYRLSVVGDIHTPHLQEKGGRYVMIPGSPEAHTFGDKGERGWYIVDMQDNSIEIDTVVSGSPLFITVEDATEIKQDGNFYKIVGKPPKEKLDNVKYVAPSPDVVEARNILSIKDGVESMLQKWLEVTPPEDENGSYLDIGKDLVSEQDIIVPQNHKLTKVSGYNFCSYKEFEYDVNDGVTLVVGRSDKYDSNGSGKSSLSESVYWCLFGKTTKGLGADDVIRWGEKQASVEVTISMSSGKTLKVRRERTPQLKLSAWIDEVEIPGDTNRDLESKILGMLGVNEKLFRSLSYFSQEDVVLLSRASDAEIKDIISDLAGLSGFQEAATVAGKRSTEISSSIEKTQVSIESKTEELERQRQGLADIDSNIKEFENSRKSKIKEYTEELNIAQNNLEAVQGISLTNLQDKAERLIDRSKARGQIIYNETYASHLAKKQAETEKLLEEKQERLQGFSLETDLTTQENLLHELETKVTKCVTKIEEVTGVKNTLSTEEGNLSYELKQLREKLADYGKGICPECGQPLSGDAGKEEEYQTRKREIEDRLNEIEEKQTKISDYLKKVLEKKSELTTEVGEKKKLLKKISERDALAKEIETIKETSQKANESEAQTVAENKKSEYERRRSELIRSRLKRAKTYLTSQVDKYQKHVDSLNRQISDEENKENPHTVYKKRTTKQISDLEKEIEKVSSEIKELSVQADVYSYWQKGFGKSGIQSLLMDEIANAFNNVRGKILPALTDGYYDVQLSTQSQLRTGEVREKISFLVFDQGQEVPYEALSGGQRRRVDLGVLLTMTAAVCESYGIQGLLGIMSLDEVTSYLDETGAEALAQTLHEYVDYAVPSVYLISHDPNLQALFSQVMEVEMENGVSRLRGN